VIVRILLIVACIGLTTKLHAQESFPESLLGFLKADQYVSVRHLEGGGLQVTIYNSKEDWDMKRDVQLMQRDELRKKYPVIEKQIVAEFDRVKKYQRQSVDESSVLTISSPPGAFGKILLVGKDYVLIEINDERAAYAHQAIESVTWGNSKLDIRVIPHYGPRAVQSPNP
jgi:hypothetical protein